jgi:hypothetical protein
MASINFAAFRAIFQDSGLINYYYWGQGAKFGLFTVGENLEVLCRLAHSYKPKKMLELYTAGGYTALALARTCPESQVVTFDVKDKSTITEFGDQEYQIGTVDQIGEGYRGQPEESRITQLLGDAWKYNWADHSYDLIYIDGLNTWNGVTKDTALAMELANDNALLVWDDFWKNSGVVQVIDKINVEVEDCVVVVEGTRTCFLCLNPSRKAKILQLLVNATKK